MKKLKFILPALFLTLLCGCNTNNSTEQVVPQVTQKTLLSKYEEDLNSESVSFDMNIDMDMSATTNDITVDMKMNLISKNEMIGNEKAYSEVSGNANVFGMDIPVESKSYVIKTEDGVYDTYTYSDKSWVKSTSDTLNIAIDSISLDELKKSEFSLSETDISYILDGTINFHLMEEQLDYLAGAEINGSVPIKLEFDKEQNIKSITMDLSTALNGNAEMKIAKASLVMNNFEFNTVTNIEVPKEALNAQTDEIEEVEETDLEVTEEPVDFELAETFEWKDEYNNVKVDNIDINIGTTTINDLAAYEQFTGIPKKETKKIGAYEVEYINLVENNYNISVEVFNNSEEEVFIDNLPILHVSVYNGEFNSMDFSSILNLNDTLEVMFEKLGQPTYATKYDGELYTSWDSEDKSIVVMFDKDNNISNISIGE